MKFAIAVAIALNFWSVRGVEVPCNPVPVPNADVELPKDQWGYPTPMAYAPGCRILMSSDIPALRKYDPAWYCADIVHELGHAAGLSHVEHGIMARMVTEDVIPHDCVNWKKTIKRLQRKGL